MIVARGTEPRWSRVEAIAVNFMKAADSPRNHGYERVIWSRPRDTHAGKKRVEQRAGVQGCGPNRMHNSRAVDRAHDSRAWRFASASNLTMDTVPRRMNTVLKIRWELRPIA
jgi:hypothetical protein